MNTTTSHPHQPATLPTHARIVPWHDPTVDERGHDPRSLYVEYFWLGVLGPTATWLLRRLAAGLDHAPDGYDINLEHLAGSLGLSIAKGTRSPFGRALHRCQMFNTVRLHSNHHDAWEVRRRIPTIPSRHLARLPETTQQLHEQWDHTTPTTNTLHRAQRVAAVLADLGDDPHHIETHLTTLGIPPLAANQAAHQGSHQ